MEDQTSQSELGEREARIDHFRQVLVQAREDFLRLYSKQADARAETTPLTPRGMDDPLMKWAIRMVTEDALAILSSTREYYAQAEARGLHDMHSFIQAYSDSFAALIRWKRSVEAKPASPRFEPVRLAMKAVGDSWLPTIANFNIMVDDGATKLLPPAVLPVEPRPLEESLEHFQAELTRYVSIGVHESISTMPNESGEAVLNESNSNRDQSANEFLLTFAQVERKRGILDPAGIIDPARYTTWNVTLSNPETNEVVSQDFDNEHDAEAALEQANKERHFPRRSLHGNFYPPLCDECNVTALSKQEVEFRIKFGCTELVCEECFQKRRVGFRERAPEVIEALKPFVEYHARWEASSLKFFAERVSALPDVPGVYCLSMLVTDSHGRDRIAKYIGQSSASIRSRCLDHATTFADALLGSPPRLTAVKALITEHQHLLGLFYETHYRRRWHEVFTPSEFALLTNYSRELIYGRDAPDSKPQTGGARRLTDFVKANGARFDVHALETFSDIDPYDLSEDRWASIHTGLPNKNSDLRRILNAEAKWQREFGTPEILRLWTIDTTKRLDAKPD